MASEFKSASWLYFTGDALVHDGPCLMTGLLLNASASGGDVMVYDGVNTNGGRILAHIDGLVNVVNDVHFEPPVFCARGIYIDIGSDVNAVSVGFIPLPYGTIEP